MFVIVVNFSFLGRDCFCFFSDSVENKAITAAMLFAGRLRAGGHRVISIEKYSGDSV